MYMFNIFNENDSLGSVLFGILCTAVILVLLLIPIYNIQKTVAEKDCTSLLAMAKSHTDSLTVYTHSPVRGFTCNGVLNGDTQ